GGRATVASRRHARGARTRAKALSRPQSPPARAAGDVDHGVGADYALEHVHALVGAGIAQAFVARQGAHLVELAAVAEGDRRGQQHGLHASAEKSNIISTAGSKPLILATGWQGVSCPPAARPGLFASPL